MKRTYSNITRVYKNLLKNKMDLCDYFVKMSFSIILDFWYDEIILDKYIDWNDKYNKNFYNWLKKAVNYIENERPEKLKKIKDLINKNFKKDSFKFEKINNKTYQLLFNKNLSKCIKKISSIENKIEKKDKEIVKSLVKYYPYFWT